MANDVMLRSSHSCPYYALAEILAAQAHRQKEWMASRLAPHLSLELRRRFQAAGPQNLNPYQLKQISAELNLDYQTVRKGIHQLLMIEIRVLAVSLRTNALQ